MTTLSQDALIKRLVQDWGYSQAGSEKAAQKLLNLQPLLKEVFEKWWDSGVAPEMTVEGYTFQQLVTERGMKPTGAFITLDWLLRDPAEAKKALISKVDYIVRKPKA